MAIVWDWHLAYRGVGIQRSSMWRFTQWLFSHSSRVRFKKETTLPSQAKDANRSTEGGPVSAGPRKGS